MKSLLLAAALLAIAASASAHDLGTRGTVYPIAEPDLLETIMGKLAKVDWNKKSREMLADAEHKVSNYEYAGLTPATETKTRYVDPSIVLQAPISAPAKPADPDGPWRTIYPAGTRVNPLKKVQPPTRLLVFDPRSPDQVAFATAALHAWPTLIELVSTGGDIKGQAKRVDRPVFYANTEFVEKFHLEHTPSLIGVGTGVHQYDLAITEFGPADAVGGQAKKVVEKAWYGIGAGRLPPLRADVQAKVRVGSPLGAPVSMVSGTSQPPASAATVGGLSPMPASPATAIGGGR